MRGGVQAGWRGWMVKMIREKPDKPDINPTETRQSDWEEDA
jgi:NADH:ubiquinone oxidoreductase subunit